jgi:hypothetical protein
VEAIRDVRIRKGKKEYFVKWEDYDESVNTWEPNSHLRNVRDMIEQFEAKRRLQNERPTPDVSDDENNEDITDLEDDEMIPRKVLRVNRFNNVLYSRIQWNVKTDGTTPDNKWVSNSDLADKFPDILIRYYEDKIKFIK